MLYCFTGYFFLTFSELIQKHTSSFGQQASRLFDSIVVKPWGRGVAGLDDLDILLFGLNYHLFHQARCMGVKARPRRLMFWITPQLKIKGRRLNVSMT